MDCAACHKKSEIREFARKQRLFLDGNQLEQMGDTGNTLSLLAGGGGHEGPRGSKQHIFQFSLCQLGQDMAAQHCRRASAAGPSRMDVLLFPVKKEQAAVLVYRLNGVSLLFHKLT